MSIVAVNSNKIFSNWNHEFSFTVSSQLDQTNFWFCSCPPKWWANQQLKPIFGPKIFVSYCSLWCCSGQCKLLNSGEIWKFGTWLSASSSCQSLWWHFPSINPNFVWTSILKPAVQKINISISLVWNLNDIYLLFTKTKSCDNLFW